MNTLRDGLVCNAPGLSRRTGVPPTLLRTPHGPPGGIFSWRSEGRSPYKTGGQHLLLAIGGPLAVQDRRAASSLGDRRAARRTSGMVAARRRHPRSFVLDPHMIPALFVLRSYRFRAIYRGIPGRRLPPPPKGTRKGRPDKMLQRDIMARPSLLNRGPTNPITLCLRILGGNLGPCSQRPGERSHMDL